MGGGFTDTTGSPNTFIGYNASASLNNPANVTVASWRPGYAMNGTSRRRLVGAVVGKALEPLNEANRII